MLNALAAFNSLMFLKPNGNLCFSQIEYLLGRFMTHESCAHRHFIRIVFMNWITLMRPTSFGMNDHDFSYINPLRNGLVEKCQQTPVKAGFNSGSRSSGLTLIGALFRPPPAFAFSWLALLHPQDSSRSLSATHLPWLVGVVLIDHQMEWS